MANRFEPRRRWPLIAILALAALVAYRAKQHKSAGPPQTLEAGHYHVKRVIDGDTLELDTGARVRLIGVDAPETKFSPRSDGEDQPLARDALLFAERAVEGQNVRLEFDKERIDKYGRFLAYVWYADRDSEQELLLNEELVRAGLAKAVLRYPYAERMKRRFRAAEQDARQARRGLWTHQEHAPPGRSDAGAPLFGVGVALLESQLAFPLSIH